jgi:16S rRNA (guanine966-N2)-methyltransferase
MKITGGEAKGRTLRFPSGSKERPTSDFLREALFNLLGSLEGNTFLDLFSGSGSVGLEAASRGAKEIYFIEKDKRLAGIIEKNVQNCHLDKNFFVIAGDIENGLRDLFRKKIKFDIIFVDPPYNRSLVTTTLSLLKKYQILKEEGVIVIQHSLKENFTEFPIDNFNLADQRKYGENALTFFKMERE